jgi:hypothetical protein
MERGAKSNKNRKPKAQDYSNNQISLASMHFHRVLTSSFAMVAVAAASSCTIIGYVDTTDATSIATQGGTNVNEYFMGWTLIKDGSIIATPQYGNGDPCAYKPAVLDSPLPYAIEWTSSYCDPDVKDCSINYGDQIGITGTSKSDYSTDVLDTSLSEACYVDFTC